MKDSVLLYRQLRKQANIASGALLIYFAMLNTAGFVGMAEAAGRSYLLFALIAVLGLLLWKGPGYFTKVIWQKGKPMPFGGFFALLCLVMAPQLVAQLLEMGLQGLWDAWGSVPSGLQSGTNETDRLAMFLYVGIAAPIAEELLFRGLLLRTVAPYSKKLAVFASSLLFGLFHGSLSQVPYAVLLGLVLGYVALEHHIVWAVILHLFNNLVFALLLPQLLVCLPGIVTDWILWTVMIGFFLAAVLVLIAKHEQLQVWWKAERVLPWQRRAFFRARGVLALIGACLLNLIVTSKLMLT